jgi:hypothetical protein
MINKSFPDITKDVIDGLVAAKVGERRTLDYKETLNVGSDDEKREFLYDVSSFANAAGGDLVFGIKDQKDSTGKPTGFPEMAVGLPNLGNASAEIARLESLIISAIAPRIPGIQFQVIGGFEKGSVLHIRIPKSWVAPHMVTFKNATRFYSRNSTGKYNLDVQELRSAFVLSEGFRERLKRFRDSRVAAVIAGETPVPIKANGKVILHLVAASSLELSNRLNISASTASELQVLFKPPHVSGWNQRFNLDGLLTYSSYRDNYAQIFEVGAIEAVDTHPLDTNLRQAVEGQKLLIIPTTSFEREIISSTDQYLKVLQKLGVSPPVFVFVTFVGAKGYRVPVNNWELSAEIDRDTLFLPEVLIEDFNVDPNRSLKPIFDGLARAAGLFGSLNYDLDGARLERR